MQANKECVKRIGVDSTPVLANEPELLIILTRIDMAITKSGSNFKAKPKNGWQLSVRSNTLDFRDVNSNPGGADLEWSAMKCKAVVYEQVGRNPNQMKGYPASGYTQVSLEIEY